MTCEPLANTGIDAPIPLLLAVAVVMLGVGAWSLSRARRANSGGAAAALLLGVLALGIGSVSGLVPASPAYATPAGCPEPDRTPSPPVSESAPDPAADNSLTITQTSTLDDLAPGVRPAEITGVVVNNGPDTTFITAISVEILSVTKRSGSAAGSCDATDYVLLDTRMAVGRTLTPEGGSTSFTGAAIGFNNKSSNQDACQGATVQLRYRTVAA